MDAYATCPYRDIDPAQRWDLSIASTPSQHVDPGIVGTAPKLTRTTRIASAGSCFAQRISETLRQVGYNFLDKEPPPSWLKKEKQNGFGYGIYSARYGNVYTALQLLQLLQRAMGEFVPVDEVWTANGRFIDPFRPRITPTGYVSSSELTADRDSHLRSVLALFQEVDVFVFTLGLTEAWIRKKDGAVLPVCPGCGVGTFDDTLYSFHNFDIDEVVTHCEAFLLALARVNPAASVILTVSPVPLAATMERGNVLLATSYSKAVLRVAAQTIVRRHRNVCYFPSYEIVTQSGNSQAYFAADRRTVTEPGISHVMSCFFRNFANVEFEALPRVEEVKKAVAASPVVCDEEELSKELAQRQSLKA